MRRSSDALVLMREALVRLDRSRMATTAGCHLQWAIDILAHELALAEREDGGEPGPPTVQ